MSLKCFKQQSKIIEFKWESILLLHIKDFYTTDKQARYQLCVHAQSVSRARLLETPWIKYNC